MKNKTISVRLTEESANRIEDLRNFYAKHFEIEPETIKTTDIVNWAIALLYKVNLEPNSKQR